MKNIIMVLDKRCSKCLQVKNISLFNKDRRRSLGIQSECRDCNKERNHTYEITKRNRNK